MGVRMVLLGLSMGVMPLGGSYASVPDHRPPCSYHENRFEDQGTPVQVRRFLTARGYSFERMAAQKGSFYALIARRPEGGPPPHTKQVEVYPERTLHELRWDGSAYFWDGQLVVTSAALDTALLRTMPEDEVKDGFGRVRELLLVEVGDDSVMLLHEPLLVWHELPSIAEWLAFDDTAVNAFLLTFNNNVENVVSTSLFHRDEGMLSQFYHDEVGSCWPAELRDIDNDGQLELVTFVEDVLDGDCSLQCHYDLKNQFGVIGAWVQVREWSGISWVPAEDVHPSFYSELAAGYERAASGFAQQPRAFDCWNEQLSEILLEWAERARSLGAQ